MKFLIVAILSLFLVINTYSQYSVKIDSFDNQEHPAWFIYRGDTVGLVFTIAQVQKIDSDLELLSWLEKKGFSCDSTIKAYIKVVDEMGKQITILKTSVSELNNQIGDKDKEIKNLKQQIDNYKKDLNLAEEEIKKFKDINENNKKRITNLKVQRNLWIGGGLLGTIAASVVTFFIMK